MFADGLDELDNARDIVHDLTEEYKACERPDYAEWTPGAPKASADATARDQDGDTRVPQRR